MKRKDIVAREQSGVAGALEVLSEQIRAGVALAEFLVALPCAASVVSDGAGSANSGQEAVTAPNPPQPLASPQEPQGS
jgi:hypothetical protein